MHRLDVEAISRAQYWLKRHTIWLCTVLSTYGSSPRSPGTMMVINDAGQHVGSLSGGCVEEDFLQRISSGQFEQESQKVIYGDGGLTPNRALPCGGILSILVERLTDSTINRLYLNNLEMALLGSKTLSKKITLPHACSALTETAYSSITNIIESGDTIVLSIAAAPQLVIAGLSEVALACASFSVSLGFQTVICEARDETLDNYRKRLPEDVILHETFPAKWLEENSQHKCRAIVSLTHDPRIDDLTLMEAVNSSAFYIGAMGSDKNSKSRINRLRSIGGLTDIELSRIHAPIGIDINSKTPAEIAISILADIVKTKNSNDFARI